MIMFLIPHCVLSDCSTSRRSASFTSRVTVLECGGGAAAFESGGKAAALQKSNVRSMSLTSAGLNTLDDHRNPLPSADARGGEAVALLAAAQLVENRQQEARAGGAERMAERDRAAVDVQLLLVDVELFRDREDLSRERFVDLDEVDVVELHPRALERELRRRGRADAHELGIAAGDAPGDDAAEGLRVFLLCLSGSGDDEHRRAVDDAGGVAGGDEAVFRERGLELREAFHGGVGTEVIVGGYQLAFASDRHGDDLFLQPSRLRGFAGAALAAQRELVLLLA